MHQYPMYQPAASACQAPVHSFNALRQYPSYPGSSATFFDPNWGALSKDEDTDQTLNRLQQERSQQQAECPLDWKHDQYPLRHQRPHDGPSLNRQPLEYSQRLSNQQWYPTSETKSNFLFRKTNGRQHDHQPAHQWTPTPSPNHQWNSGSHLPMKDHFLAGPPAQPYEDADNFITQGIDQGDQSHSFSAPYDQQKMTVQDSSIMYAGSVRHNRVGMTSYFDSPSMVRPPQFSSLSGYDGSMSRRPPKDIGAGFNLKPVQWDMESLNEFHEMHYTEHPEVAKLEYPELQAIYHSLEINVQGDCPKVIQTFDQAPFPKYIRDELYRAGYTKPYPIQSVGWPIVLSNKDMIGIAQTGSGKTLAYLLPALVHIGHQPPLRPGDGPIILVLAPTRELAVQICKEAGRFVTTPGYRVTCVYGGAPRASQSADLTRGVHICIATPGRLLDFLESGVTTLKRVTYLVVDEADRMLDMGFEPQMRRIESQIRPDRLTMMWSATWPKGVQKMARDFCRHDPVRVTVGSHDLQANKNIHQSVMFCHENEKFYRLLDIIHQHHIVDHAAAESGLLNSRSQWDNCLNTDNPLWDQSNDDYGSGITPSVNVSTNFSDSSPSIKKLLIFCETKRGCDILRERLSRQCIPNVASIHGDKEQRERDRVLAAFKSGTVNILIATDVASRGLDIKDIDLVVNYDVPKTIEDYIHRIGRTGRAGAVGTAITLFSDSLGEVERMRMARQIAIVMADADQTPSLALCALASGETDPIQEQPSGFQRLPRGGRRGRGIGGNKGGRGAGRGPGRGSAGGRQFG